jgi:hypothetical protein
LSLNIGRKTPIDLFYRKKGTYENNEVACNRKWRRKRLLHIAFLRKQVDVENFSKQGK